MNEANKTTPQHALNQKACEQVAMAAAAGVVGGYAVDEAKVRSFDRSHELLNNIEQLLNANRRIELVQNSDGTIDVRCGGIATYGRGLRNALQSRVDIETARVTDRIMGNTVAGAGAGALSGGSLGINKTRP